MNSWVEFLQTLTGYGVAAALAAALAAACGIAAWGVSGRLLLLQRLRPGRWTGVTFLIHLFLYRICMEAAVALMASVGLFERILPANANAFRLFVVAAPLGVAAFFAFSVQWLSAFSGTPPSRVGLGFFRWRENVVIGAMAFFVATPVVSAIYAAIAPVFHGRPHPAESMFDDGSEVFEWILLFAQTVVFAPLVEEWLFRGLLQGWLRRTNLMGHALLLWAIVSIVAYLTFVGQGAEPAQFYFTALLAITYAAMVAALYRPVLTRGLKVFVRSDIEPPSGAPDLWTTNLFEAEGDENRVTPWSDFGPAWQRWKIANAHLAIFGSAMVFAALHPWPTPIPLFAFGLVAGWLAYRTQNLVPSIVFHSLFNVVAFVVLWLKFHPGIIGNDDRIASPPPGSAIVAPAEPAPR